MIWRTIGAATVPPSPSELTTITATAISGFCAGAKAVNQASVSCGGSSPGPSSWPGSSAAGPSSAVPVLPATWIPGRARGDPGPGLDHADHQLGHRRGGLRRGHLDRLAGRLEPVGRGRSRSASGRRRWRSSARPSPSPAASPAPGPGRSPTRRSRRCSERSGGIVLAGGSTIPVVCRVEELRRLVEAEQLRRSRPALGRRARRRAGRRPCCTSRRRSRRRCRRTARRGRWGSRGRSRSSTISTGNSSSRLDDPGVERAGRGDDLEGRARRLRAPSRRARRAPSTEPLRASITAAPP